MPADVGRPFLGWRMVAVAALTQNVAVGLSFGAFGPMVLAIEQRFAVTRTLSTLGISLVILMLSLGAPSVAWAIRRSSIRRVMTLGAALAGTGYLLLPLAHGIVPFLLAFALLIGPGVLMLGSLPSGLLASNWFVRHQGRAMGLVTMPVLVMLVPVAASRMLERYGLDALFIAVGLAHLAALPFIRLVVDRPEQIGQRPLGHDDAAPEVARPAELRLPDLLAMPILWATTVAVGIAVGGGVLKAAHLVPLVMAQGLPLDQAAFLLALSGGTGIVGALAFGWLADKVGPGAALALNCLVQALVWFIFLQPVSYGLLVLDAIVVGACGGGLAAAQGVLLQRLFGRAGFARAMALIALLTAPFTFGITPLAGWLFQRTGGYHAPIAIQIAGFFMAAAIFLAIELRLRRGRRSRGEGGTEISAGR